MIGLVLAVLIPTTVAVVRVERARRRAASEHEGREHELWSTRLVDGHRRDQRRQRRTHSPLGWPAA